MTTHAVDASRTRAPAGPLMWLGFVVLCNGVGFLSSLTGRMGLYQELVRPSWAPPAWIFGPVWAALYTMMATATYLVWRHTSGARRRTAMTVFAIQLALNCAWTPVFFGLEQLFAGFLVIVAVWCAVLAMTIVYARRDRVAGALVVPLLCWVGFAGALNAAVWWLNR
ncbi:MAG: tryptophan-rich sensory protein [Deltaproteobacteria bacterium]|nr:tryptophan-rich sensory protein [Deltaproteobacteria bacterium]